MHRTPVCAASPRPRRGRGAGLLRVLGATGAWGLIAGLVGFNAWWYWRDTRPLPDTRTIDAWIEPRGLRAGRIGLEGTAPPRAARRPCADDARPGAGRSRRPAGLRPRTGAGSVLVAPAGRGPAPRGPGVICRPTAARDAESAFLAILDDDPLHPPDPGVYHDAGQELLKIYAIEDRWEDAYAVIWKAYDHAAPPDRPLMLTMRIRCELERVAPTETLKVLRRYVAADPADFEARRAMARAELAVGQRSEALRDMEACLSGRPDDPRAWRDYLTMLQSLGEQDAFNAAMDRLPRSAESEPEIWMFRGQIKERNGDWPGAAARLPPGAGAQSQPAQRPLSAGHPRGPAGPPRAGRRPSQAVG